MYGEASSRVVSATPESIAAIRATTHQLSPAHVHAQQRRAVGGGDIKREAALARIENFSARGNRRYRGSNFPAPPARSADALLVDRPARAVQHRHRQHGKTRTDPDYFPLLGCTRSSEPTPPRASHEFARRQGYTYGAYTSPTRAAPPGLSRHRRSAHSFTGDSLKEFLTSERIREEVVTEKELRDAQSYLRHLPHRLETSPA